MFKNCSSNGQTIFLVVTHVISNHINTATNSWIELMLVEHILVKCEPASVYFYCE
jgi:hypothetical protein